MADPVIKAAAAILAHTPDLIRYGSKPTREIEAEPGLLRQLLGSLRDFPEALGYLPNQVFIGNAIPEELLQAPRPWFKHSYSGANQFGPYGEISPQEEFYGWVKLADQFDLIYLEEGFAKEVKERLAKHPLITAHDLDRLGGGVPFSEVERAIEKKRGTPLFMGSDRVVGCVLPGHEKDASQTAAIMLENLACKATAGLALRHLLDKRRDVAPEEIDYVLGCSEEAVGDRYQRGGGNMGKAAAEMAGCHQAGGSDVKNFCAAPVPAIVFAASLVKAGVFSHVAVVGGASLPKLGMKFRDHLLAGMPVLEDVQGAIAVLIGPDDGISPRIRLAGVGQHPVKAGSSAQAIMESLVLGPLKKLGLGILDIDRYATELHNPEVTEPAHGGDVPVRNYRIIGSLAVMSKELDRAGLDRFVREHGVPGFAPTQGHIASAVAFLTHARELLVQGKIKNCMIIAKGSLFLGKMTQLSDGMSFVLERNCPRP